MRSRVVVAEEMAAAGLAVLAEAVEVDSAVGVSRADLLARLPGAAGLVVRSATRVDAELLAAGSALRVVGRAGTGTDNIDVEAATRAGILVVNAPDANSLSAAEHTLALLLALARRVPEGDRSVRSGGWERKRLGGVELAGKTLGIVGLGRIGRLVAERARAFGMKLLVFDPFVSGEKTVGVERAAGLTDLMSRSDFVTLHVPLSAETRGLIGEEALGHARPGLRLVNTARGGIVDEDALAAALRDGRVAGAALDVFATEPPAGSPLLALPQVVVTPHLGASTDEAQARAGVEVAGAVVCALRGELVPTAVNVDLGAGMPDEWQPYLPVAETLGAAFLALARALPGVLRVEVAGELSGASCRPLALAALKGALGPVSEGPVTYVNSLLLARDRGLRLKEASTAEAGGYPSLLRVTGEVGERVVSVAGAVLPRRGPALVEVLGREIELPLGPCLLLVNHADPAGIIGRLGTFLGERGVGIVDLAVARSADASGGLLGLGLARSLVDDEVVALRGLPGVLDAWPVELAQSQMESSQPTARP